MDKTKRREYTQEFKQQAASLANRIGVSRAAQQLGVSVVNVQRWKSNSKKSVKNNNDKIIFQYDSYVTSAKRKSKD